MGHDGWISVLQWTIHGLVLMLVMGWVSQSRFRDRPQTDQATLHNPVSILILGLIGAIFFFGIAIVSNTVGKNATTTVWTTLVFVLFGSAFLAMLADYAFTRHRLSDSGIEYGRILGQPGNLAWSDIIHVRYAPAMKWFILKTQNGKTVRISAMLMGLPEFARLLLLYVPTQAIDPATLPILEETRNGRPPSI